MSSEDPPNEDPAAPQSPPADDHGERQGSLLLFEEDYFGRTLGTMLGSPDIALTELVANAWDAGAALVEVELPANIGDELVIRDDGVGMDGDDFERKWLTLAYNRLTHEGRGVNFPPGAESRKPRAAYGRNGIGRHAMLCFAADYEVSTRREGTEAKFRVMERSGARPLEVSRLSSRAVSGHGTTLSCTLSRRSLSPADLLQVLSARFIYDPEFVVRVNGEVLRLEDHDGLVIVRRFDFGDGQTAKLSVVDSESGARSKFQHGVAFWVNKRLVGAPSWTVGKTSVLDGRTREARRLTFIVELEGEAIEAAIEADWTGFRNLPLADELHEKAVAEVQSVLREVLSERVSERVAEVVEERRDAISSLAPLGQLEVAEFARDVVEQQPFASAEVVTAAVDALVRIENSRSGQALIQKLSALGPEDVVGLNRLLEEWTVRDALTVLDEVGKRVRLVETIERLCRDGSVDELGTLHPLVAQARWLFGMQFDTPHFISNVSLNTALRRIVGARSATKLRDGNRRPDLIVLDDGSLAASATDRVESDDALVEIDRILLLELKKGASTIGRAEMNQAYEYVEDLVTAKEIDGQPFISAFVVGADVDSDRAHTRELKDPEQKIRGKVEACSFDQLVRTAGRRLFRLRDRLDAKLPDTPDAKLIQAWAVKNGLFEHGRGFRSDI